MQDIGLCNNNQTTDTLFWAVIDLVDAIHVYPTYDIALHKLTRDCPCLPKIIDLTLIIHNSYDNRESSKEIRDN